jgi:hypothetical protein
MSTEQLPQFKNPALDTFVAKKQKIREKISKREEMILKVRDNFGKEIKETFPHIAEDYIGGLTLDQLVSDYHIQEYFGITNREIARGAVLYALRLLVNRERLKEIGKEHQKVRGEAAVAKLRKEGRAFFGMSKEERAANGSKSGNITYQNGTGVHGQNAEERIERSKKGIEARGFVPFSEEEINHIKNLDLKLYRTREIKTDTTRIAREMNQKFHNGNPVRTGNSITQYLQKLKKQNGKHAEEETVKELV